MIKPEIKINKVYITSNVETKYGIMVSMFYEKNNIENVEEIIIMNNKEEFDSLKTPKDIIDNIQYKKNQIEEILEFGNQISANLFFDGKEANWSDCYNCKTMKM